MIAMILITLLIVLIVLVCGFVIIVGLAMHVVNMLDDDSCGDVDLKTQKRR